MTARSCILILLFSITISCNNGQKLAGQPLSSAELNRDNNLLLSMSSSDLRGFQWMNAPQSFTFENGILLLKAGNNTDYFNDPATGKVTGTAPLLYREVDGDFVFTVKVKPDFSSVWNAGGLMVYQDSTYWGKLCYENSDVTGPSIVSVVTREVSDDSNGQMILDTEAVWLRIARKENVFAMYWSLDGNDFKMARLFSLPNSNSLRVGLEAQCPAGPSVTHEFLHLSLELRTVNDLRKGI